MKYISTRGGCPSLNFEGTILQGLAPDGGLYVPYDLPAFTAAEMQGMAGDSYRRVAFKILSRFAPDFSNTKLWDLIGRAYTPEKFCHVRDANRAEDIVPVRRLFGNTHLVQLSNGPTLAFKDMALQLLGELMEHALSGKTLNVLGATSGDTGSAAIHALMGRKNIKVFMLSAGAMSDFQMAQMYCVSDENIFNIKIKGDFDSAQSVVKDIFGDASFKTSHHLGAVNSINWARIAAQVVYYVWSYLQVQGTTGDSVDVSVPSGNFGNAYAALVAKQLGVPIRNVIIATNENDVLHEFVQTGVYRRRDATKPTMSPSMDIQVASNLERFIYNMLNGDVQKVYSLYEGFSRTGQFNLEKEHQRIVDAGLRSVMCSEEDCRLVMQQMYHDFGIFIDPHTAVALFAASRNGSHDVPMLVMETAQSTKFADSVRMATGKVAPVPRSLTGLRCAPKHFVEMDPDVDKVRQFIRERV